MRPFALAAALCLALALAGCGGGSALELRLEQWCAPSAYVDLVNAGAATRRYTGWRLTDSAGAYALPAFELRPGAALRVWRGAGHGDVHNVYLAQPEPTWEHSEAISAARRAGIFEETVHSFSSCDVLPAP